MPCVGDTDTLALIGEALDAEKPDLVVGSCFDVADVDLLWRLVLASLPLTSDQLNGQKTSYDSRSVLAKFATPVIDRKISWAAIFGNHDSEILEDRDGQMRWLQTLPYSLSEPGPAGVDGVGNCESQLCVADCRLHQIGVE